MIYYPILATVLSSAAQASDEPVIAKVLKTVTEHWRPLRLVDQVDSPVIALVCLVVSTVILSQTLFLGLYWRSQMKGKGGETHFVSLYFWISVTLFCCALGGYGSLIAVYWLPRFGVVLRLLAMGATLLALLILHRLSCRISLVTYVQQQYVGAEMMRQSVVHLDDRDLGKLARTMSAESVSRIAGDGGDESECKS